jgi:prophage regulatory protein
MQNSKHENSYHQTIEEIAYQSLDPLFKIKEVERLTSKSKSALLRDVTAKTFPAPVRIGKRAVAWRLSSLRKWQDELETTVRAEG